MNRGDKVGSPRELELGVEIGRAAPGDLDAVLGLLTGAALPREGVAEHFVHFLVARAGDRIVGSIGMEPYGPSALLRSLVVAQPYRRHGLGGALTDRVLAEAIAGGVTRVFLLTETAADFFTARGFRRIGREEADAAVRDSVEFRTACCQTAVCMRRDL